MALNRERPHLLVLPEDDATRSLANGFIDGARGPMQALNPARGWSHVLEEFMNIHADGLRKYPLRHIVLLIDFDNDFHRRLAKFQDSIPQDISDRVYVLGALGEAEDLKNLTNMKLGPLGQALAGECDKGSSIFWANAQLQHNLAEVLRLQNSVKNFLF